MTFCSETKFEGIKSLSFSQQKMLGFRQKLEFESRRLLVGSKNEYSMLGYSGKSVYPLLSHAVEGDLVACEFLEDCAPTHVIAITKLDSSFYLSIDQVQRSGKLDDSGYHSVEERNTKTKSIVKETF